jgi:hypothetical protein
MTEKNERLFWLRKITNDIKLSLAQSKGYIGTKDPDRVLNFLLDLDRDIFDQLIEPYKYGKTTTNHIFKLDSEIKENCQFFSEEYSILDNLKSEKMDKGNVNFKPYFVDDITYFQEIQELWFNVYHINRQHIEPTIDSDFKKRDFRSYYALKIFPIRIYLDEGLLILRCDEHKHANDIIGMLEELDPHFKAHELYFNEQNKIAALQGACVRNCSIEFGRDKRQKEVLKYSIGTDKADDTIGDLTILSERFKAALHEKGHKISYVSISALRDPENSRTVLSTKDPIITFRINFSESKVFFSSYMKEDEIKIWLLRILHKCNLDLTKDIIRSNREIQEDIDEFEPA